MHLNTAQIRDLHNLTDVAIEYKNNSDSVRPWMRFWRRRNR